MKKSLKSLLAVVAIVVGIFAITACGDKKVTLVGKWAHDDYVYNFKEDKTGSYTAFGTELKFTYEDKGDKIAFRYDGNTEDLVLEYKIEGKTLTIKDSFGEDVEYIRK